jgi:oligosaccharide repeat unit polymerase
MTAPADLASMASATVLVLLLAFVGWFLARRIDDPFGLFVLVFGVFYAFRAVLVGFGLDEPSPEYLFASTEWKALHTRTILALCLFLFAFLVAGFLTTRRPARTGGLLFDGGHVSPRALVSLAVALTIVSLAVGAWLVAQFGDVSGITQASKVSNELAGLRFLKVPSALGAILGTAAFLDLRSSRVSSRRAQALCLACAVANSILVFAWGQRTLVLIVIAMVVISSRRKADRPNVQLAVRVIAAALLVIAVASFLRDTRDNLIQPKADHSFSQQSFWRRASLGVNGVYFDASMLAFRDWPDSQQFRDGEDFRNGLLGTVPRRLWPDKPDPLPGKWFRNVYEPEVKNGWPVGTPTLWFLNFGWLGLVVGGLFSGALYGEFTRRARAAPRNGINIAMTFVFAVLAFPMGWASQSPLLVAAWLAPMLILMAALRLHTRVTSQQTGWGPTINRHPQKAIGPSS